jgi:hypothetical protein
MTKEQILVFEAAVKLFDFRAEDSEEAVDVAHDILAWVKEKIK